MPSHKVLAAVLLSSAALGACSLTPAYTVPSTPPAEVAYHETGAWTPAAPADAAPRGAWWSVFGDPALDALEQRIDDSPQLAAAVARYDEAGALARQADAGLLPTLSATGFASKTDDPRNGHLNNNSLGLSAGYEVDLWGRMRALAAAGRAEAQASAADLAGIRLSLQARLAETYISLRGADAQIALLQRTNDAYQKAFDLTNDRYKGGASGPADVGRAKTLLSSTQAQLEQSRASRALLEHALAVLVGQSASTFRVDAVTTQVDVPQIPVDAPSQLLQRRPDVAAAERRVFEANQGIGVAKAAFFPDITLAADGGNEEYVGQTGPFWAIGPAAFTLPIFDGGAHSARLTQARAAFTVAADQYRQTVLGAFQDVEDQLALANHLAVAADHQDDAVTAASETNRLALVQYREGAASYLDVVTAQTAELQARSAALDIHTRRLLAGVDLIRALGGGWQPKA
jgi:NodT family efflux transporter outer membrane factor (OMF) lipoprotein